MFEQKSKTHYAYAIKIMCFILEKTSMKRIKNLILSCVAILYFPTVFAGNISGNWTTTDDKTGKVRSIVQLTELNNTVSGQIIKVFPNPGDTGICSNCPGTFKNKKIQGLHFIWDLKKNGENTWDDGKILDPKSGKIYRAKITLDGNKLFVRGYLGISLLGRTQVWDRN